MAAPPDLRVLCRRLDSTEVEDLPRLCPLLVGHVLRCGQALSAAHDAKAKDRAGSETPMLVHKLRTHITTLLNGKSPAGRFAAVCLVKAVIDAGGWETLRAADPWLKGLIGVVQKSDPLASKELAIVALTKIYVLLQGYQTLIREMATPTLPSYVTACLQLIKPPASGRPLRVPATFVDTVACSLSKLVVLYPTTLRPFATQMKAALRAYIAPTSSDSSLVPEGLRDSSRRLYILLSYTAPKNSSSEEWAKAIRSTIMGCHAAVDQVFRAVVESWESTTGYRSQATRPGADPSGGGDTAEELPSWTGVQAGSERLIGLLDFLSAYLDNPTKAPVTLPLGELLDLTGRITLVAPPSTGTEDSNQTNPAIGRDERAELWSVLPDIHIAVMRMHAALIRRLRENAVPLATDMLDQMVRVFTASRHLPAMRAAAYTLTKELLLLSGPTLPKLTVDSLTPLIQSTCHDTLLGTGYLNQPPAQEPQPTTTTTSTQKPPKPNPNATASTNADAYLTTPSPSTTTTSSPSSTPSTQNATTLLPNLLSHLPQPHLAPDQRALLDRTAVLAHNKPALLASCLHPYRDARGRYYASVLPFLVRQFPRDQDVEVLRSNLVRVGRGVNGRGGGEGLEMGRWEMGFQAGLVGVEEGAVGDGGDARGGDGDAVVGGEEEKVAEEEGKDKKGVGSSSWGVEMEVDAAAAPADDNPFAAVVVTAGREKQEDGSKSPLKRKSELFDGAAGNAPKRVDTGKAQPQVAVMSQAAASVGEKGGDEGGDESDSEGSVQIDMTLEDDEEEEEEEEEEDDE